LNGLDHLFHAENFNAKTQRGRDAEENWVDCVEWVDFAGFWRVSVHFNAQIGGLLHIMKLCSEISI
jgi:hypothetical protein